MVVIESEDAYQRRIRAPVGGGFQQRETADMDLFQEYISTEMSKYPGSLP
jgi:hypothetical protein